MADKLYYIDLFAGAGGLSEGFIRTGFTPVVHVEADCAASFTLKTRAAWHWLVKTDNTRIYRKYLYNLISRDEFYANIPDDIINSVINMEISKSNNQKIFDRIDALRKRKKIHLIIGGPPCQAYSLIGRNRDKYRMQNDPRNFLFIQYAEFLKKYSPEYFIFENVTGLYSAKTATGEKYFDMMRDLFYKIGYSVEYSTQSSYSFGVLQSRDRVILIGRKGKKEGFYPEFEKEIPNGILVEEIFKDLPALDAGEGTIAPQKLKKYEGKYLYQSGIKSDSMDYVTYHIARSHTDQDKRIYRIAVELWKKEKRRLNYNDLPACLKTQKNRQSFLDRFKVVAADEPYCHTMVAHIFKDGHYYIHPDSKQNRSLTPREAARIQSFPDDYFFESVITPPGKSPAFRQIGNAVPVLMAEKIAYKIKEKL